MRFLLAATALILAGCSGAPAEPLLKQGTYFGQGRDALCVSGKAAPQRGSFIAFAAEGDSNCAAEGRLERQGDSWSLVPAGEGDCRIPLIASGDTLAFGPVPAACSYYCGPAASFAGQRFTWNDTRDRLLKQQPLGHGGAC